MEYDSDSESEDGLVEKLKLLSPELTRDEKGYDLYLRQYLPLLGVHRSYASQPESKAYKIGLLHFLDSPEHGCDPEESVLSAYVDQEIPKSLGCPEYEGRVKANEISKTLLVCHFTKPSSPRAVKPSSSMRFDLLQRDMIDVRLNDGSDASEVIAVCPPPRVLPLLLPCTGREPQRKVHALNTEVQIEL
ncbi:g331 [Coccomyxa viridis]|uniref:G331 protein n=1 Tax=Coccomyxa viridis TaxID=1274662 RepID=A0ABP1FFG0_9CHLO